MIKDMMLPECHDVHASTWQSTPRARCHDMGEAHEKDGNSKRSEHLLRL